MFSSVQKEKFLLNIATVPGVERKFVNTDYFANVCHEIRTPLSAIVGLAAILARPDVEHKRQTECATMLQDSSHSGTRDNAYRLFSGRS